MERIRRFNNFLYDFGRSIVEWRSPATAPYLMLINSAFWAASLYCEQTIQLRLLVSVACGVFGWDVLLSPTHERNIATHVLFWPVQSMWRTLGVALSMYSAHVLRLGLLERAFWSAYATVGCLLVNPVWNYYETNQKIMNGVSYSVQQTKKGLDVAVVRPVVAVYRAIKYVVLLEFIPPMWAAIRRAFSSTGGGIKGLFTSFWGWICGGCRSIKEWWISCIYQPTKNGFYAFGRWLRYWFCAHWWPDFKAWCKVKIGVPLQRFFNYVCYCLVYVFCGHWVKPLCRFLWRHLSRLGAFLHRTVAVPTKLWLIARLHDLSLLIRSLLHRLAVAIRDSVLWPICLLVADCAKQVYAVIHRTCIQPVLDYLYVKYKIVEDALLIYLLGPVCEKVINNIPEKSPFCEDSDVELEGMLPDEISEDAEVDYGDGVHSDSMDEHMPTPLDEEEHDFAVGLSFPNIHASESSDEEFDLMRNRERQRVKRVKKKPGSYSEVDSDGETRPRAPSQPKPVVQEILEDDLIPHAIPTDHDSEFELLR